MPPKANPLKLNALQLKTLTLLQEHVKTPGRPDPDPETGAVLVGPTPRIHGDHFHIGPFVVMSKDATGLFNQGVWKALIRKGLAATTDQGFALTREGQAYETGLRDTILHGSDH
jgi:hypothetical protein